MDTTTWILLGIILFFLIVYIVFTFIKKLRLVSEISVVFILPLLGLLDYFLLCSYTPDSYHTITISIVAFSFISVAQLSDAFSSIKRVSLITALLFLISTVSWGILYGSEFFIHRFPLWINILAASSYFILYLLFFLIFIKKQKFSLYFFSTLALIIVSFLHYSTIMSLYFNKTNFNVLKLIGSTLLLAYVIFRILNSSIINLKLKKLISFLTLLASQVLFALANLMIFYY